MTLILNECRDTFANSCIPLDDLHLLVGTYEAKNSYFLLLDKNNNDKVDPNIFIVKTSSIYIFYVTWIKWVTVLLVY